MEMIANPFFVSTIGLGLIALLQLLLHLGLKAEVVRRRNESTATSQQSREVEAQLRAELDRLSAEIAMLKPSPISATGFMRPVNLSRRNQVLRLHHRGDSVECIASSLQLSRNEVELMLKVHKNLSLASAEPGPLINASGSARAAAAGGNR
jgi:hypothetical protein